MGNQGRRHVTPTGLIVEYSPVTVDAITTPEQSAELGVNTNKYRAQLRQSVKTSYPAARGNALFQSTEFGSPKDFTEKRVTWLNVPQGTTVEQVVERLNALECPTLVRTLGLKPILSEDQIIAMDKGINTKTMEQYMEDFVRTSDEEARPVPFNGRLQFRAIHFSATFADDNDNRIADLKELQRAEAEAALEAANSPVQMSSGQGQTARREQAPATL